MATGTALVLIKAIRTATRTVQYTVYGGAKGRGKKLDSVTVTGNTRAHRRAIAALVGDRKLASIITK